MCVARKMRGYPVEYYSNAFGVKGIDQLHELLRRAIAARWREVSCKLVTPRSVERVFHDRHELDVCETKIFYITDKLGAHFGIGERTVIFFNLPSPTAEVNFVNRIRFCGGGAIAFR